MNDWKNDCLHLVFSIWYSPNVYAKSYSRKVFHFENHIIQKSLWLIWFLVCWWFCGCILNVRLSEWMWDGKEIRPENIWPFDWKTLDLKSGSCRNVHMYFIIFIFFFHFRFIIQLDLRLRSIGTLLICVCVCASGWMIARGAEFLQAYFLLEPLFVASRSWRSFSLILLKSFWILFIWATYRLYKKKKFNIYIWLAKQKKKTMNEHSNYLNKNH